MAFPGAPETNATLATRDAHATAQLSNLGRHGGDQSRLPPYHRGLFGRGHCWRGGTGQMAVRGARDARDARDA